MFEWFSSLPCAVQALAATLFTWAVTAAGAVFVFAFKGTKKGLFDALLGFAGGVMIAASFFSLLSPAAIMAEAVNQSAWLVLSGGFLSGGALLFAGDAVFNYLGARVGFGKDGDKASSMKRCLMLVFSITLHNIPEGLAVGVAFGSLLYGIEGATLGAALMLALGIGLQNFPEGMAVSLPLRREGFSKLRSFFYGQLSGVVEPIAGVTGAVLVMAVRGALPFLLSFAAGAMIYVVVAELIPESQSNEKKGVMAFFTLVGFAVMMLLDVALG